MNKQEFYKKYTVKIRYHDELTTIELKDIDPDELWQWIEQQIKQARVEENEKHLDYLRERRKTSNYIMLEGFFEDRIKELTGELK